MGKDTDKKGEHRNAAARIALIIAATGPIEEFVCKTGTRLSTGYVMLTYSTSTKVPALRFIASASGYSVNGAITF